ncbi:hypothetical protein P7K49_032897 [Saguinus oedipus]|uniref:Uncharacterized protein n=1 Tax=Saguinus oedipus TaxID=9490 RepID=A0ABQ9TQD3_SAGOE|nr:hypothetical protein P7K49_032897 [Saguinus oedipus]
MPQPPRRDEPSRAELACGRPGSIPGRPLLSPKLSRSSVLLPDGHGNRRLSFSTERPLARPGGGGKWGRQNAPAGSLRPYCSLASPRDHGRGRGTSQELSPGSAGGGGTVPGPAPQEAPRRAHRGPNARRSRDRGREWGEPRDDGAGVGLWELLSALQPQDRVRIAPAAASAREQGRHGTPGAQALVLLRPRGDRPARPSAPSGLRNVFRAALTMSRGDFSATGTGRRGQLGAGGALAAGRQTLNSLHSVADPISSRNSAAPPASSSPRTGGKRGTELRFCGAKAYVGAGGRDCPAPGAGHPETWPGGGQT